MVYEVWIPLHSYGCLQATPVRGICGDCYAYRQQHWNEELLFDLGRRDSLQNRPSSNLAGQRVGMPGLAAAAVAEFENSDSSCAGVFTPGWSVTRKLTHCRIWPPLGNFAQLRYVFYLQEFRGGSHAQ